MNDVITLRPLSDRSTAPDPKAPVNVIPFPARAATFAVSALLDGEGFFTQSDEDFLADLGIASNDPHMPRGQRLAFRPA